MRALLDVRAIRAKARSKCPPYSENVPGTSEAA
jgi:hypothetical protein